MVGVWRGGGHKGVEVAGGRTVDWCSTGEGNLGLRSGVVSPVLGRSLSAVEVRSGAQRRNQSVPAARCWACKFGPPGPESSGHLNLPCTFSPVGTYLSTLVGWDKTGTRQQ